MICTSIYCNIIAGRITLSSYFIHIANTCTLSVVDNSGILRVVDGLNLTISSHRKGFCIVYYRFIAEHIELTTVGNNLWQYN